jgi:hypothetical protein
MTSRCNSNLTYQGTDFIATGLPIICPVFFRTARHLLMNSVTPAAIFKDLWKKFSPTRHRGLNSNPRPQEHTIVSITSLPRRPTWGLYFIFQNCGGSKHDLQEFYSDHKYHCLRFNAENTEEEDSKTNTSNAHTLIL